MNHNNHLLPATSKLFPVIAALFVSTIGISQPTVSVAPIKMNVLYIGVDNPVSIAASSSADNKLTVSIEGGGGKISKIHDGLYNVSVTSPTDNCLINIFVDGKLTGTSKFRVRPLPQPFATVGGFKSGTQISPDNLQKQVGVGVAIENSPFDISYHVVGFTMKLADDKGTVKSADCDGNLFSSEAKQFIDQYTKSGQIVTIENIRVKAPDGNELHLPSLLYPIK